jgi:UMF1 family MFS transporter
MRRFDRTIVAWCLYDFANSGVSAIVVATIFPVWYAQAIVGNAEGRGDFWWGLVSSATMIIVAVTSPLLGGIADHAGVRKPFFIGLTLASVAGGLLLATLGPGMVLRGFFFAVLTLVTYEAAIVYYNAYLPRIAPPERLGSVSAMGFAVGYAGSIVAFLASYPLANAQRYGACFVVTAVQFALFALPSFLTLPADTRHAMPLARAVARGLADTLATLREIATDPARLALRRFLTAYFIFEDGVNTVIFFAGIFASKTLGFSFPEIIVLFMIVQLTALLGSAAWARPTDRKGPKFVITVTLVQWIAVTVLTYFVREKWHFWIVAILAGTGLGAIQAASRAFMASLVPANREAEFFGFYSLVGKTGAIMGPLVFGGVSWLMSGDQRSAIAAIGAFFVVGLVFLARVPTAAVVALAGIAWLAAASAAEAAEPFKDLKVGKACAALIDKKVFGEPGAQVVLGHLYFTEDAKGTACGWSSASHYGAYTACTRTAAGRGIAAPCLPVVKDSVVVASSYPDAERQAAPDAWERRMSADPLQCGQEPGSRRYWLEHGFCDVNIHGPEKARGIVIWNHGIFGTIAQYRGAPALALRMLHASGWDVIKINRHNLAEGADSNRAAEERTREEIAVQRRRGYQRIVLAGQSFGGRVTLELGTSAEIFGAIAMAPNMEVTMGNSRTQAPTDDRLRRATVERMAVIFPGQDELFGNVQRGATAGPVLARRGRPYLMVDESGGLKGHGGATGGNFALRYGRCLDEFLTAADVPAGRFECKTDGGWAVARELLPAIPSYVTVLPANRLPAPVRDMAGVWYGVMGDSIVMWALVDAGKPVPGMLYAWTASSTSRGGGVYEAAIRDATVTALFPNKATLAVRRRGQQTITATYTPTPGESNFGMASASREPVAGDLKPVDAR